MKIYKEIKDFNNQVVNSNEEEFLVTEHRGLGPFSITVKKSSNAGHLYTGECEYGFWGPEQFGPYRRSKPQDSIDSALKDAIQGLTFFDKEEYPNEVVFYEKREGNKRIYIDGNGNELSKEEAVNRMNEYKNKESK